MDVAIVVVSFLKLCSILISRAIYFKELFYSVAALNVDVCEFFLAVAHGCYSLVVTLELLLVVVSLVVEPG